MDHIEAQLQQIISEYTEKDFKQELAAQAFDDLGIDSLSLVEIIFDIEEAFDIKIPQDNDLENLGGSLNSYDDVLQLVKKLVKESNHND
ncbi:hypothetical protein NBRC116592_01330 [Colwellia sp. KU-HH00111]|uniref:acyl carrier protein n=1 Tax=Colwellia sp. KU-HH00111 TaxID=3127652 RepID=UPI0031078980